MGRWLNWWRWGYLSSTCECFDIGMTVGAALRRFEASGNPFAGSTDASTAGNGALMRLAPVVLFFHPDAALRQQAAVDSTRTTHAAPEALDCSRLLARVIERALNGATKLDMLAVNDAEVLTPNVAALARGAYFGKDESTLRGSGYSVESLEAALWCFARTPSFEAAVLRAANLGDDADTTAAIVGQIAGAHYGIDAILPKWRACLHMGDEIDAMARALARSGDAARAL